MGIVTIVVAAEAEECESVGDSNQPLNEWSGIDMPGMDIPKIAMLHCLLTGDLLDDSLDAYEPIFVSENHNIVLRVADVLMDKLVAANEEGLECVASELVATEAFESENLDPEDALNMLIEFAELAQLAESQGQALLVWMHFD